MALNQIDCFIMNIRFWKILGIYPRKMSNSLYHLYSFIFVTFVLVYVGFATINIYFLPKNIDIFIEDMLFFFTEVASVTKVLSFVFMSNSIVKILYNLEKDIFQPKTDKGIQILNAAKKFNVRYWKIIAVMSYTSHLTHILSPLLAHILLSVKLELPVCTYSFLSENVIDKYIYPLFLYQTVGIHFIMLYNLNIDTFLLGLMILVIAQLEILEEKLTDTVLGQQFYDYEEDGRNNVQDDKVAIRKLNNSVIHFDEVNKFCMLIEDVFSVTLFVQFSMASCIICVCLFRFTLPAPWQYYIFLTTYIVLMIIQIMIPCWFGTRIIDKSCLLSQAIYNSRWISLRSGRFHSSMRLFVERANKPLTITAWKMFPLSLKTFTSIMNSAYSFFTLLQQMQSK